MRTAIRLLTSGVFLAFALPFATIVFTMHDCGTSSTPAILHPDSERNLAVRAPMPSRRERIDPSGRPQGVVEIQAPRTKEVGSETRTGYELLRRENGPWLLAPLGVAALFFLFSGILREVSERNRIVLATAAAVLASGAGAVIALWVPGAPSGQDAAVVPGWGYWLATSCLGGLAVGSAADLVRSYDRIWKRTSRRGIGRGLLLAGFVLGSLLFAVPLASLGLLGEVCIESVALLVQGTVFLVLPVAVLLAASLAIPGAALLLRAERREASVPRAEFAFWTIPPSPSRALRSGAGPSP